MDGMKIEIRHSNIGEYYEMYVDGELYGCYDTVLEAARDIENDLYAKEEAV